MDTTCECDIAVIGGGLGGVAAALAAAEAGKQVILSEVTDWIGGQVTAQGVSALDEHQHIETFGGTRSYYRFREGVRAVYRQRYGAPGALPGGLPLNPGGGWVSALCFEPRVGLQVLEELLAPHIAAGRLRLLLNHAPLAATVRNRRIRAVTLQGPAGELTVVRAEVFLDATETGDLLPLAGAPYVCGAEAVEDTGEPHASADGPHPTRVQSFTWCFFVEYRPGEDHIIRRPQGYEAWRDEQPFTLTLSAPDGSPRRFYMFAGELPFWTYRRALEAGQFRGAPPGLVPRHDIALINWDAHDYYKESFIDRTPAQRARIYQEARRLSLSFLYWLQTEAPRDTQAGLPGAGRGYPGLMLLPGACGTPDGLAKAPYIRESRRLLGLARVLEQDITARPERGARALAYADSVGVGWYPIDLHRCAGDPTRGREQRLDFDPSLPFQIPLGALLSPAVENLVAAAKNIATTHITNGAYRLHPVEWNIGEAAGSLAAYCLDHGVKPRAVRELPDELRRFQSCLLARGVPLAWATDAGLDDPDFAAFQRALLGGAPPPRSPRRESLLLRPGEQISRREAAWLFSAHPLVQGSDRCAEVLARWQQVGYPPLAGEEFNAALMALDLPAWEGSYPSLREVCRRLYS